MYVQGPRMNGVNMNVQSLFFSLHIGKRMINSELMQPVQLSSAIRTDLYL